MHMRAVKHTIRGGLCTHHAAWVNHTENRCTHPTHLPDHLLCLDEFDALSLLRRAGQDGVYLQSQEHHQTRHVEPEHEDYHRPELAGESEQIVASHPEHYFPKHPEAEEAFQVRVELSHACVGYPARWVRTMQVPESGLRRIPLLGTSVNSLQRKQALGFVTGGMIGARK